MGEILFLCIGVMAAVVFLLSLPDNWGPLRTVMFGFLPLDCRLHEEPFPAIHFVDKLGCVDGVVRSLEFLQVTDGRVFIREDAGRLFGRRMLILGYFG